MSLKLDSFNDCTTRLTHLIIFILLILKINKSDLYVTELS